MYLYLHFVAHIWYRISVRFVINEHTCNSVGSGMQSPTEASDILKIQFKWKHLLNNAPEVFFFFFFFFVLFSFFFFFAVVLGMSQFIKGFFLNFPFEPIYVFLA